MNHEGAWRDIHPRHLMIDGENLAPAVEYDIPPLLGNSVVSIAVKTDGQCTIYNRGGDPIPSVVPEIGKDGKRFIPGHGIRMVVAAKTLPGYLGTSILGAEEGTTITIVGIVGKAMESVCKVYVPVGQ